MPYNDEEKKETASQQAPSNEAEAGQEEQDRQDTQETPQKPEKEKKSKKEKKADPAAQWEQKYQELNDKFLRTLAEYDNFRKRSQREKDAIYTDAVCDTASKFLSVLDSFDRALSFECADEEFKKGVEMIRTAFIEALGSLGVTEVQALGKPFDPNTQNAVMHVEDDSVEESCVVEVFQKGYELKGKVLRHAMVKVAN